MYIFKSKNVSKNYLFLGTVKICKNIVRMQCQCCDVGVGVGVVPQLFMF